MTTLLMFVIGLIAIIFIARFNESNKLFWTLLISFVSGIAVAGVYDNCTHQNKNENKVTLTKSTPMYQSPLSMFCFMKTGESDTTKPLAKSVSNILLTSDCTYFRSSKNMENPILTRRSAPLIRGQCTKSFIYDTS